MNTATPFGVLSNPGKTISACIERSTFAVPAVCCTILGKHTVRHYKLSTVN
jgi:hypothetical protein